MKWVACVMVMATVAAAAPAKTDIAWSFKTGGDDAPDAVKFGFDSRGVNPTPKAWSDAYRERTDIAELVDPTIATAADGGAAWVATSVKRAHQCRGPSGTWAQCKEFATPTINALVLYAKAGTKWNPVAIHAGVPVSDQDLAKRVATGMKLGAVPSQVDASAKDAVALFQTSFADPQQLAASVSDRKDVALFGSAPNEKTVGGGAVAKKLGGWKLAFTVHDGVAAGTVGSIAWVAANVDARPAGKADAKPTPYRVMCLYEKMKTWKLVAVEFSFVAPDQAPED